MTSPLEPCPTCGRRPEDDPEDEVLRPSQLSKLDQARDALLYSIERGNSIPDACAESGVHHSTFYDWLEKGRDQIKRKKRGIYRTFLDQFERARATSRTSLVKIVRDAAQTDPYLALQMLERLDPSTWAPKVVHLVKEDREKVLMAVYAEFENEPEIVTRFLASVAGVEIPGRPARLSAEASVEGTVVERVDKPGGA